MPFILNILVDSWDTVHNDTLSVDEVAFVIKVSYLLFDTHSIEACFASWGMLLHKNCVDPSHKYFPKNIVLKDVSLNKSPLKE
mmetsp:Transcript_5227/g.5111  ORF Transcript_5227/g.5111 Transcript_5227/m.5111 type:complete len:83 (-) Transcript_5227:93-341(-)